MSAEQQAAPAAPAAPPAADAPLPVPEQTAPPEASPAPETPLTKLAARLPSIITQADYSEMWGVQLSPTSSQIPTQVILQKFLRANNNDVAAAEKQLTSALEWRKKMQPAALVNEVFDSNKFGGLGFVTSHLDDAGKETIITWNIYGAVKSNKTTFGDVEEFIRWRAALMELSIQQLKLNDATELIPDDGVDQYQMLQVHDYLSVSFLRMDPNVKAASKETIQTFSMAYPELLAHKYFVNVPAIMGWMYGAMKLFLAPATLRKFHPMTSGTTLSIELKDISASLPKEYGGQGPTVKEGRTVILSEVKEEPKKDAVPEAPADAPVADAPENKPSEPVGDAAPAPVVVEKSAEVSKPDAEVLGTAVAEK